MCAAKSSVSSIETSMRCYVFNYAYVINCSNHRFLNEAFDAHIIIITICLILCVVDIKKNLCECTMIIT
jgi:hypothetical protein